MRLAAERRGIVYIRTTRGKTPPIYGKGELAVRGIPHSGRPQELLERYGIDRKAIVGEVRKIIG